MEATKKNIEHLQRRLDSARQQPDGDEMWRARLQLALQLELLKSDRRLEIIRLSADIISKHLQTGGRVVMRQRVDTGDDMFIEYRDVYFDPPQRTVNVDADAALLIREAEEFADTITP